MFQIPSACWIYFEQNRSFGIRILNRFWSFCKELLFCAQCWIIKHSKALSQHFAWDKPADAVAEDSPPADDTLNGTHDKKPNGNFDKKTNGIIGKRANGSSGGGVLETTVASPPRPAFWLRPNGVGGQRPPMTPRSPASATDGNGSVRSLEPIREWLVFMLDVDNFGAAFSSRSVQYCMDRVVKISNYSAFSS